MSIIELMVASTLSLVLIGMAVSATVANREAYSHDLARTRLNQNIRGAFDLLSAELRQAGERLPPGFPAIEIADDVSAASDRLTIRRNLLDEVLTLCVALTTSSGPQVMLSTSAAGAPPACTYGSQSVNYNAWRTYRLSQPGQQLNAYIYDFSTQLGEFFVVSNDSDNGSSMYIQRQSGSWQNAYSHGNTAIYVLREWVFALSTTPGEEDLLVVTQDRDALNPLRVAFGVRTFRAVARMQTGDLLETFGATDGWTNLRSVDITIAGAETYKGRQITTSLNTQLFPRNILSN